MPEDLENLLLKLDDELDDISSDKDSELSLPDAALFNKVNRVKELIAQGADANIKNDLGETPIQMTINPEIIDLLVAHGADVHIQGEWGNTPLHDAARYDYFDAATALIRNGANVNAQDNDGDTPLHNAYAKGNEEIADLLIKNGADINAKNNDGKTPLDIKHQYELNEKLFDAVNNDDVAAVKKLIELGADVNTSQCRWFTPLYTAKSSAVAELLIQHGADVNAINDDGESPLYWASVKNHIDTATVLIQHGADVNAVDYCGCTPLGAAKSNEMTELLVKHGAQKDKKE